MPLRILCLYLPRLRALVERLRRPEFAATPLLVYQGARRPLVLEASAEAAQAGVRPGMLLSRAQSLCPQATSVAADEAAYRRVAAALAEPMLRLTPEVSAPALPQGGRRRRSLATRPGNAELGIAFMRLRGLERLVGDEQAVARLLVTQAWEAVLAAIGAEPPSPSVLRAGIAGTPFAAQMAAMYGKSEITIVPAGQEAAFLAPLPLATLPRMDAAWRELHRRLALLGLRTLGEVAALGRVALQAQAGEVGLAAWRLASGQDEDEIEGQAPPEAETSRQFEPPLTSWPDLEAALRELAIQLAAELRSRGWSCAGLRVRWQEESGRVQQREAALKEPIAGEAGILAAARRPLYAAAQAEAIGGPIVALSLLALALTPEAGKQMRLFPSLSSAGQATANPKLLQVAAELEQRLGSQPLLRVRRLGDSPLEERTYDFRPLDEDAG